MKTKYIMDYAEASRILTHYVAQQKLPGCPFFNGNCQATVSAGEIAFEIYVEPSEAPAQNTPNQGE